MTLLSTWKKGQKIIYQITTINFSPSPASKKDQIIHYPLIYAKSHMHPIDYALMGVGKGFKQKGFAMAGWKR